MKRKIIRLGKTALIVTLPKKWAQSMNILDKKEINCDIKSNELIFSVEKESEPLKKTIDISYLSEKAIRMFLSGLQKGGYDEIEVFYKNMEQLNLVNELIKDLSKQMLLMAR